MILIALVALLAPPQSALPLIIQKGDQQPALPPSRHKHSALPQAPRLPIWLTVHHTDEPPSQSLLWPLHVHTHSSHSQPATAPTVSPATREKTSMFSTRPASPPSTLWGASVISSAVSSLQAHGSTRQTRLHE